MPSVVITTSRYTMTIRCLGNNGGAKDERLIVPLALGTTVAGNRAFRAYQFNRNSRRGAPEYKYFRLDRVTSWRPMKKSLKQKPDDRYNENGDDLMAPFEMNAPFEVDTSQMSPLEKMRYQHQQTMNAPKVTTKNVSRS